MTLIDPAGGRYAKLKSDRFGEEMAKAMPTIPAETSGAIASMKTDVSHARVTGRSAVIQGVDTEEREIAVSIEGSAMPNVPAGPVVRMVLQLWTAKPGEVLRVPAIRELTGYSLWTTATMNPVGALQTAMKQLPGFSDTFEPILAEMQNGTTVMRMHIDMFLPAVAAMFRQASANGNPTGAGFDPDAPFMQINLEAVELSSAPVLDSFFQIPAGYQETAAADLIKGVIVKK